MGPQAQRCGRWSVGLGEIAEPLELNTSQERDRSSDEEARTAIVTGANHGIGAAT